MAIRGVNGDDRPEDQINANGRLFLEIELALAQA
jgi:hypothetical protein